MISLKDDTVKISGLVPEICMGLMVVATVFTEHKIPIVITAGTELFYPSGKRMHMMGSKHESGEAVDLRSRDVFQPRQKEFTIKCQKALGSEYDFILEGNHFHLEFDLK